MIRMKLVVRIFLSILFAAALVLAVYLLQGPIEKETWTTLTGLLAVMASVIVALPALRVLEIQEDALRPRPTPHFDLTSRYDLLQLRVKNVGGGVAYDVQLHWKLRPTDHKGNAITSLDRIAILLPQESVSTLVGAAHDTVRELSNTRFEGVCRCRDSAGTIYRDKFICSVDANQKQLVHDSELPKTLRELQKIPEELNRIVEQLERGRTVR